MSSAPQFPAEPGLAANMELRERNKESLQEKLKEKWATRDFTPPKDHPDKFLMSFFFIHSACLLIECLVFLVPNVYLDNRLVMSLVTIVMFCETVLNWHRSYFDVANYVRKETKDKYFSEFEKKPQDWGDCFKCQVVSPPRSHHCNLCGKCMLKRDHHCFFTGSCIGFYNQKFYVMFCLWSTISTCFTSYMQFSYLHSQLPIFSSDVIAYIFPATFHRWIMGYITFLQMLIILHLYINILMFIISLFGFLWQCLLIGHGYTSYEAWKNIQVFRGATVMENIKSVFGSVFNIPILIFVPYRFEQCGDGIQWKLRRKRVKGQ